MGVIKIINGVSLRPAWTPAELTTSNLWLDASDASTITLNGANVSQWDDKSGANNHAVQAVSANQPAYSGTVNGNNVIDWGTTDNVKGLGLVRGANTDNWRDLYVVAFWDDGTSFSGYNGLFQGSSTGSGDSAGGIGIMALGSGQNLYVITNTWGSTYRFNGIDATSTPAVLSGISTGSIVQLSASADIGVNGYAVGRDRDYLVGPYRGWRGRICEVVSCGITLGSPERQKVEGYLAHKWGLTAKLASDHPYKYTVPTAPAA